MKSTILFRLLFVAVIISYGYEKMTAQTVTDIITRETFVTDMTTYVSLSDIKVTSEAVYAGNICKEANLGGFSVRNTTPSGLVTTASGGKVQSITVTPNYALSGRTLCVYGKSSAYTFVDELYSDKTKGTLIGQINCGKTTEQTITVEGDYEYIGFLSSENYVNIDVIKIVWRTGIQNPTFSPVPGTYDDTQEVTIEAGDGCSIYYTTNGDDPTAQTGTLYEGQPVIVDKTTTIKAVAFDATNTSQSDIVTGEYRIERLFAFSATTAIVTLGEEFEAPSLTNTYHEGTVTWNSSDDNVAEVDTEGNISLKAAGTTTISATLNVADPLTASYILTVKEPVVIPEYTRYYRRVTSDDDIVDGGVYLIVCEDKGLVMGSSFTSSSSKFYSPISVGIDNGIISTLLDDAEIALYKQGTDGYALMHSQRYINYDNSSTDFGTPSSNIAENCKWTISVNQDSAIILNKAYTGRVIRYNGYTDFRVYSDLRQTDRVALYRKMGTLKITSGGQDDVDGRYYATYYTDVSFVAPVNVTCATVGVTNDCLAITQYKPGEIVPANTGLLVSAANPNTYEYAVTVKDGTGHDGNLLKGDVVDNVTVGDAGEDCLFYRLAKPAGEALGFWWGADGGVAFTIGANKAYLALPKSLSEAKGFSFSTAEIIEDTSEESLSVKGIGADIDKKSPDDVIYNLSGQRMRHANKPGLYIINGKKAIVR